MNSELVHPADAAAIKALKRVPGFNLAIKAIMKLGVEQYCRALYMANHIRLSSKQLPEIYNHLPPICKRLGIKVPELYLQMYPTPNAYTVGDENNYIVITSGLVDALGTEDELACALAHECGHILCRHVHYSTMVQMMLNYATRIPGVREIQEPLALAYNAWARASELSADRVCAYCQGNVITPTKTLLRLASGPARLTENLNYEAYIDQMMEAEGMLDSGKWQKLLRNFSEMDEDHPYTVTRVRELILWGQRGLNKLIAPSR
jgi:Zn-dependent protease with chaperone function